jgi:hypothetical protein
LVIETALICSGLETNPGPTTDNLCIEGCKKGRKDVGDMLRCCLCAQWFHPGCINMDSSEAAGVWPCLECRNLNSKVTVIMSNMTEMTRLMTKMTDKMDKVQQSWDNEKDNLVKENAELRKTVSDLQVRENTDLRKTLSDMTQRMNRDKWAEFRDTSKHSIVVGSSIIRDVDENKLEDTKVICKPGGCIADIHNVVTKLDGQ